MAGNASIVVDIKAQITGYEEQIAKIKQAMKTIDPGSAIGKSLANSLKQADQKLTELQRKAEQRVGSQGQLEGLFDSLRQMNDLVNNMGQGLSNVGMNDMLETSSDKAKQLGQELATIKNEMSTRGQTFLDSLKKDMDVKAFQSLFDQLQLNPEKMGIDEFVKKFDEATSDATKKVEDLTAAQEKAQSAAENATKLAGLRQQLPLKYQGTGPIKKGMVESDLNMGKFISQSQEQARIAADNFLNQVRTGLELDSKDDKTAGALNDILNKTADNLVKAKNETDIRNALTKLNTAIMTNTRGQGDKDIAGLTGGISIEDWVTKLTGKVQADQEFISKVQSIADTLSSPQASEGIRGFGEKISGLLQEVANPSDITTFETNMKQLVEAMHKGLNQLRTETNQATKETKPGLVEDLTKQLEVAKGTLTNLEQVKNNPAYADFRELVNGFMQRLSRVEQALGLENKTTKEDNMAAAHKAGEQAMAHAEQKGGQNASMLQAYSTELDRVNQKTQLLGKVQGVIQRWFSVYAVVRMVGKAFRSVTNNVKELDDTMTEIAIVTNKSQADLWKQMPQYTEMARKYGSSISGVYKVSQLYYQQGLNQADVMKLSEETLKMARISGLDYAQATDYMTNAIRSFKMEMTDAQKVVDVYSAVSASSATNTSELAAAMSKTASSAQAVGSDFESTTAMMAVMIEATRESPENIGSALKSIISRYGELKENVTGIDEEGEEYSLNKVDKALQTVGISIHDTNGEFRDFDDVITELSGKWDTIDKNTQRYIATVMAGNRQQSRFLALVSSGERLAELTETAMDSEDAATLQVLKTMDSISFKSQQVQTSLQSLYTSSGIENLMKGFLDIGNNIITTFTEMPTFLNLPIPAIGKLATTFTSLATTITTAFNIVKFNLQNQRMQWLAEEKSQLQAAGQQEVDQTQLIEQQKYSIQRYYRLKRLKDQGYQLSPELEQYYKGASATFGKGGKGSTKLGMGLNIAGLAMSTISSSINAKNAGGRWAKGLTGIAGSALSMAGVGTMVAPGIGTAVGALAGTIMGVIENINTIAPSLESQLKDVQQKAETSRNNYLQKKDKYTSLDKEIDKLEKLKEARYDSAEANQAFLDASNSLASKYPELIDYIDEEGNAIINLTDKYTLLSAARMEAAQAATEASKDSVEYAEKAAQVAASQSKQQRRDAVANFKSRQLGEERASIFSSAFGLKVNKATTGEKVLQKLFTSDQFKGTPIQSIAKILGSSEPSEALKKLQNDKTLLDQYSTYKASHTTSEDTVLFSYLDELIGKNTAIDQNIAQKNNAVKLANKNAISTAIYWENQGKLLDKETNASGFLENMSSSTALMNEYIYKNFEDWQARMEKDTSFQLGENETYYSRYQESQFAQDYADIYDELYNKLSPFSEEKQKDIDQLLNSLDNYTTDDLFDILESDYKLTFGPDSKIREAIIDSYNNMFGSEQFANAIEEREPESDLEMSESIWGRIGELSSKGYKAVLEQYDWINDQIDAKNIDAESGQQIFDSYTSLISGISSKFALDPRKRNAMLSKLYGADLTTLTGIDSLITELQENGFTEEDIQELDFDTIKNLIPTNLSTELNSFQKKMTDGMSDYEKAISNASKGMDMKSAAEMAEKTGKTLSDFTLRDGKYFFEDYDAIQEAYLGDNAQYIQDLKDYAQKEQAKFEQIGKENQPIRRLDKSFDSIEEWATTNSILDLDKLAVKKSDLEAAFNEYKESDSTEDFFSEWIPSHYTQLVNDGIISANEYAKSVLLKSAMDSGKIKSIAKTALPKDATSRSIEALTGSLYEALRTGNFDRILKATNVSDELKNQLPQMKVAFDDARSSAVNSLVDSIDAGYKYIEANDYNKDVLQKMESQGLAKLQYRGDEIIGAVFENTTDNIDQIYEFIEDYAVPLGLMTEKEGREKRAQLKQQQYELTKSSTFSNLIKNYDNISQVMFEEFQSSWKIKDIEGVFKQQADGSYKANLPKLAQFAREHMSELDELAQQQIEETLTKAIDDGMTSITSASDYVTKGTTKYSDMTAFVKQFNEALPGAQATIQDLFGYDKDAQGYVLDPQKYRDYLTGQKQMLQAMGESTEYIDGLIQNANQSIYDAIDIKSFLDAENKQGQAREKLTKQLMNAGIWKQGESLLSENWQDFYDEQSQNVEQVGQLLTSSGFLTDLLGTVGITIDPEALKKSAQEQAKANKEVNDKVRRTAAEQMIQAIEDGGIEAVNAMQTIATLQGKELTSADIESAYRAQVSRIEAASEKLTSGVGSLVSGEAIQILENAGYQLQRMGDGNTAVIEQVGNIANAYAQFYETLKSSGEATLESLNSAYAKVLETRQGRAQEQQAIEAIGNASGMTFETLGTIFSEAGINLEQYANELERSGIIESLGGNKVRIKDFAAFARRMNWNFDSEEYTSAFSSFNDGLIDQNKKAKEQIRDEVKQLEEARPGDWLNLTQFEKAFKKISKKNAKDRLSDAARLGTDATRVTELNKQLALGGEKFISLQEQLVKAGAYLEDGILKLTDEANLLKVADVLSSAAMEVGGDIGAEMADMVQTITSSYTEAITKGITGNITNADRTNLIQKARNLGLELSNMDFIQTAEGLNLSQEAAISLYTAISETDALQGNLTFKTLSDSLKENNKNYKTATDLLAHIGELERNINGLKDAQNDKDVKRKKQLQEELALAKEIAMQSFTHEEGSWDFLSADALPFDVDNAITYWEDWAQSQSLMKDWKKNGYADLDQFSAMLQHVEQISKATGESIEFMGTAVGGATGVTYDEYLDKLSDVLTYNEKLGKMVLDKNKLRTELGFDLGLGEKGYTDNLEKNINKYVDDIATQAEALNDTYSGLNSIYESFHDTSDGNKTSFEDFLDLTTGDFDYSSFRTQLSKKKGALEAFDKFTDQVKINGKNWKDVVKENSKIKKDTAEYDAMSSIIGMAMSEDWDLDSDYAAIAEQMAKTKFTGEFEIGEMKIVAKRGKTVIETKDEDGNAKYYTEDGEYTTAEAAWASIYQKQLDELGKKFGKSSSEVSGGEFSYTLDGETYTIKINGDHFIIEKSDQSTINGEGGKTGEYGSTEEAFAAIKKDYIDKNKEEINEDLQRQLEQMSNEGFMDWASKTKNKEYDWTKNRSKTNYGGITSEARSKITQNNWNAADLTEIATKLRDQGLTGGEFASQFGVETGIYLDENTVSEFVTAVGDTAEGAGQAFQNKMQHYVDESFDLSETASDVRDGITAAFGEGSQALTNITTAIQNSLTGAGEDGTIHIKFKGETENVPPKDAQDIERKVNYTAVFKTPNIPTLSSTIVYHAIVEGAPASSAKGNVALASGLAHAKSTLMGELGPEMVVSNGRYFVVGQNGPEFVDLADDAIVFNHLQTQSLLTKGMSNTRGRAVTNEQNAVAYAHGNLNGGPAHPNENKGNVGQKQRDTAGGGSIIKNGAHIISNTAVGAAVEEISEAFIKTLDIWYNYLQEIAKLETQLSYEETLRSKLQSDFNKDGQAYYDSQTRSLQQMAKTIAVDQELITKQTEYQQKRYKEMVDAGNPFTTFYELDEDNQLRYKEGAEDRFNAIFSASKLTNAPYETLQEQYNWLINNGFGAYMEYDKEGKKIEVGGENDKNGSGMKSAIQAFVDKMEADREEMQGITDSINDAKSDVLEKQEQQNEILQEMRDNEIDLAEKVMDAIVDKMQRQIDEMTDQKEALQKANDDLIKGLSDTLSKEREMYDMQQSESDLESKRRRLAILQRSGGSASEINSLQAEIDTATKDLYFDKQQQQIDTIQEASDAQIEKMEKQIEIAQESLDWQKKYGLLWDDVYQIMNSQDPNGIAATITEWNSDYWGKNPTELEKDLDDIRFSAGQWKAYSQDVNDIKNYLVAQNQNKENTGEERSGTWKSDETGWWYEHDDGSYTKNDWEKIDGKWYYFNDQGYMHTGWHHQGNDWYYLRDQGDMHTGWHQEGNQWYYFGSDGKMVTGAQTIDGVNYNFGADGKLGSSNTGSSTKNKKSDPSADWEGAKSINYDVNEKPRKKARGGYVGHGIYELGELGTETIFTAAQTKILRDNILSNRPNSLISLLKSYNDNYGHINDAVNKVEPLENNSVVIERAEVNMNVAQIANDYDAQRAGEQALDRMLTIARKTQASNRIGR